MNYKKLTDKELMKLKGFRIRKMGNFQVKVDAYSRLVLEVNDEQVNRFLEAIKKKEDTPQSKGEESK